MASWEPELRYTGTNLPIRCQRQNVDAFFQMQTRQIEAFSRKVTTTAGHLIAPATDTAGNHYQTALTEIHRELRRPHTQRKIFALAQTTPTDLVRSKLSTAEIQSRALSTLPTELLRNLPEDTSSYSLFEGFQASLPEESEPAHKKSHRRRSSRKLLKDGEHAGALPHSSEGLRKERDTLSRRLELMGTRKNMCSAEIHEIDHKIANLHRMRQIVLDRLAGLETDEAELEHECE